MKRALWFVVLLVAFFAAYQVAPGNQVLGLAIFIVPVLAFFAWVVRNAQVGARMNNKAVSLMNEGRLVEAIAAFEAARQVIPRNPLPSFNIGGVSLWLWRLDEAKDRIDQATKTIAGRPLRIMGVPQLALIAALQNDRAKSVLLEREIDALDLSRAPVVAVTRAVWLAREGRWPEVLDALEFSRVRALGGPARALADAIRAWAMVNTGQPRPPIDTVGVLGETGPDAIRKWWPELADFLISAR